MAENDTPYPTGKSRFLLVGIAIFQCVTTAGLIFGWVSLQSIFEKDGIYSEYCPFQIQECKAQAIQLHFAFTIAASCNMIANLFLGIVFDRFGPRVCKSISFLCIASGLLLLAFSHSRKTSPGLDMFLPGLSLLGFGGTGIQLGSVHLSNLFPAYKSAVACYLVGAFAISFVIFLLFKQVHDTFNISLKNICLIYTLVVLFNFILTLLFDPDKPYRLQYLGNTKSNKTSGNIRLPSVFRNANESLLDKTVMSTSLELTSLLRNSSLTSLVDLSFTTQLTSWAFLHLIIYFCVGSLWCNYFVGSLVTQIKDKDSSSRDLENYMNYFNIILPSGTIAIPVIGHMLETCGYSLTMSTTTVLGIFYTLLMKFDSFYPIIAAFFFYSLYRTFLFSTIFAYLGHTFGYRNFGVLSGILFAIAAVFDLLQAIVARINNFQIVSTIQIFTLLITFCLPAHSYYNEKMQSLETK